MRIAIAGRPVEVDGEIPSIDLWYPRIAGHVTALEVGLIDVRASDSLRVSYDFARNGWRIAQCDAHGRWHETAFCASYQLHEGVRDA